LAAAGLVTAGLVADSQVALASRVIRLGGNRAHALLLATDFVAAS